MDFLATPGAQGMLELAFRATIPLTAALALAWLARKGPAAVRHLLWTMTFALLLGLPVLSLLGPSWEVPVLPSLGGAHPGPPLPVEAVPVAGTTPGGFITLPSPEASLRDPGPSAVPVAKPLAPSRPVPLPLLLWGVGCAAALASLALSGLRFARLVRAADPLDDAIRLRRADEIRRRLGIRGEVWVLLSPDATTPMTGGPWRPVVLLPRSARTWSPERWDVVLAHEMIHVRGRDVLRQLMARAVLALFWFHPLIWVAARLAETASEEACDEEVLALGTRPSRYATHLLALAGGMIARRPVLSLPMVQRPHSQLEKRVMAILTPHRPRRSAMATALMMVAVGGVGVSAAVAHPVRSQSSDTIAAVVAARIGSTGLGDASDEYIFGRVMSVAADRHGKIYVADRVSPSVRVFGPDGAFMAWIGREGEGPGEFTWPADLLPAADGRLFVRGSRITAFAPGESSEYPDLVVDTWRIPSYFNSASRRGRLVDGVYYYPDSEHRMNTNTNVTTSRYFYLKFGPEGFTGDTVRVPDVGDLSKQQTAWYRVGGGPGGRMAHGLNTAPFAPRVGWDMTGRGTIIVGDGETYELREYDQDGRLLRTIAGPELEPRAVPRAERADSMRALEARIDSLPVPLDDVFNVAPEIRRGEIPDSLPGFIGVHVGASDRIWVERWPLEGMGSSRYYDVLEYDGRYAGTVVVPAPLMSDPPPFFGDEIIVGVVKDPVTDVQSVVVFRFRVPG